MVQGTAKDKVVGVGRGTRLSPRHQRLGYVRSWRTTSSTMAYQMPLILCKLHKRRSVSMLALKNGEDIANELTNKTTVTIPPPVCSTAILLRLQEWERHVRRKLMNMRTALDAKLAQLQSASGIQDAVAIAEVENQVKDVAYHQG